jgi:hypothetical protein
MARGLIRSLLDMPCRRKHHDWVHPQGIGVPGYYVCASCGEPGFEV